MGLQVNLWVHSTNTPLHTVYPKDQNSSKRASLICQERSILKFLIKKKLLFKYHGNDPPGKV